MNIKFPLSMARGQPRLDLRERMIKNETVLKEEFIK